MPKNTKTSTKNFHLINFILLLVGTFGAITFSIRLALQPNINLTSLENEMNSSATNIMLLESEPADYNSKAFSRAYGSYLVGESTAWYSQLTTLTGIKFSLDLIGLLVSLAVFALGLRQH